MRVNEINSNQNNTKNCPSFQMNLEVKENAAKYFEQRLGKKLNVNKRLSDLKDSFENLTAGVNSNAVIDIEESSMGKPELIIDGLKCKKYPASVTGIDILPGVNEQNTEYSLKHLINGAYRIMSDNGQGFGKDNMFSKLLEKMCGR